MENQASSKNIMLNYGFVLGILSILTSVTSYALGMHLDRDWRFGLLGFILMVIIGSMGIKKFKVENQHLLSCPAIAQPSRPVLCMLVCVFQISESFVTLAASKE